MLLLSESDSNGFLLTCLVFTLGAAQILAGAGVDLDLVALVDEQGHLDLGAGLDDGGLGHVGGGVALDARLGLGNDQLNEVGRLRR